ncbi:FRIGIDA-like protein 1 [Fagus crenata]
MDGLGFRKFISEYPIGPDEQSGMRNEIPGALLCAPDPAALVLDAMDEFYKENSPGLKGSKRCCVLLLEEFMRIKANELVHLVAAYGLRSEFNVDDAVENVLGSLEQPKMRLKCEDGH